MTSTQRTRAPRSCPCRVCPSPPPPAQRPHRRRVAMFVGSRRATRSGHRRAAKSARSDSPPRCSRALDRPRAIAAPKCPAGSRRPRMRMRSRLRSRTSAGAAKTPPRLRSGTHLRRCQTGKRAGTQPVIAWHVSCTSLRPLSERDAASDGARVRSGVRDETRSRSRALRQRRQSPGRQTLLMTMYGVYEDIVDCPRGGFYRNATTC